MYLEWTKNHAGISDDLANHLDSHRQLLLQIQQKRDELDELDDNDDDYDLFWQSLPIIFNNIAVELFQHACYAAAFDLYDEADNLIRKYIKTKNDNDVGGDDDDDDVVVLSPEKMRLLLLKKMCGVHRLRQIKKLSPMLKTNVQSSTTMEGGGVFLWYNASSIGRSSFIFDAIKLDSLVTTSTLRLPSSNDVGSCTANMTRHYLILVHAMYNKGLVLIKKGSLGTAGDVLMKTMSLVDSLEEGGESSIFEPELLLGLYNNVACLMQDDEYLRDAALDYFLKALSMGEKALEKLKEEEEDDANNDNDGDESKIEERTDDGKRKKIMKITATILTNIGGVYFEKQKNNSAISFCKKAVDMKRQLYDNDSNNIEVLGIIHNIGVIHQTIGDQMEATRFFMHFINSAMTMTHSNNNEQQRQPISSRDMVTALTHFLLSLHKFDVNAERSLDLMQELQNLNHFRPLLGCNHPNIPILLQKIGDVLYEQEDYVYSSWFYLEQLRVETFLLGPSHPELAITLNNVGRTYQKQGMLEMAMNYYYKAMNLMPKIENMKNLSNNSIYSNIMFNIATIYYETGSSEQAMRVFEDALLTQKTIMGEYHPDYADLMHRVGETQLQYGRVAKAMENLQASLAIRRIVFGNVHHVVVESLYHIGQLHDDKGEFRDALNLYQECVELGKLILTTSYPHIILSLANIGHIYHMRNELEKALNAFFEAFLISRDCLGGRRIFDVSLLNTISSILLQKGDTELSIMYLNKASEILQNGSRILVANQTVARDVRLLTKAFEAIERRGDILNPPAAAAA